LNIYQEILKKYWGYSSFRPLQEDIIKSVAGGADTLGLMPTGGGKSITFQVPALASEGICLVVTPLIALMKDQVENIKKLGIKAYAIYSGMSSYEIDKIMDNCIYGDVKFLYISPERLGTQMFRERVVKMKVNLIAVDESHCISQWGYDFRPSYLRIADIRELVPYVPVLALTATATVDVVDDIQEKLGFANKNVFRKSFERKNLIYIVKHVEDKLQYIKDIINKVKGTGIIYVRNRRRTKEIAILLQKEGVSADYYHAGLTPEVREKKQDSWKLGRTRIIVATNAFGMGIDKPDVRFVAHIDLPDSLEAYYQEAGRAGRDEERAYAVLLFNEADKQKMKAMFTRSFPDIDEVKLVYNAVCNYLQLAIGSGKGQVFDFNLMDFGHTFKLDIIKAYSALKTLQLEGYLEITDEINNPSRVMFLVNRDELYKFQVANASFDGFVKLILRSYTGLFTEYVKIDETQLSKKSGIPLDTIVLFLQKLNNSKIIRYIPRKRTPMIIFTEERLEEKNLFFSKESYKTRKDRYEKRMEGVLYYASSTNKCRSQILLMYFGQKNANRCGVCDVCRQRNELGLTKYEFDKIVEDITEMLFQQERDIDELTDKMTFSREKIIRVIQWLVDNNKISYTNDYRMKMG
jgi:ATP-dependent DNA helicase RecQ